MHYEQLQNFEFLAEDSTSDYWYLLRQVNNFTKVYTLKQISKKVV